jgi:hypothetical protein
MIILGRLEDFPTGGMRGDIALQTPKPTPDMASASAADGRRFVILGAGLASRALKMAPDGMADPARSKRSNRPPK